MSDSARGLAHPRRPQIRLWGPGAGFGRRPHQDSKPPYAILDLQEGGSVKKKAGGLRRTGAALDRISPGAGYVRGNLVLLCNDCNGAERNIPDPARLRHLASYMRRAHKELSGVPLQ